MPDRIPAIQRTLRSILINEVLLYIIVFGAIFFVYHDSQVKRDEIKAESDRSTVALCALRDDLKTRIAGSEKFLLEHPKGWLGITPASIQQSIDGQQRTVIALSVLNCK